MAMLRSPLRYAVLANSTSAVNVLLDAGADIEAPTPKHQVDLFHQKESPKIALPGLRISRRVPWRKLMAVSTYCSNLSRKHLLTVYRL